MRLSITTASHNGAISFNYAASKMRGLLGQLGELADDPAEADVHVFHGAPEWDVRESYRRRGRRFVLYAPAESTRVLPRWVELANSCDSLWVHTEFCAKVWRDSGYNGPMSLVQNGADPADWPERNGNSYPDGAGLRVLWIGTTAGHWRVSSANPRLACRKQGFLVRRAFEIANLPGSRLLLKSYPWPNPAKDVYWHGHEKDDERWASIRDVAAWWSRAQVAEVMHQSDVFMWPTRGEGFGLVPLEAMCTGLPAFVTDWSGPCDYLNDGVGCALPVAGFQSSRLGRRRGKDAVVTLESVVEALRWCDDNREELRNAGRQFAAAVRERWTWQGRVLPQLDNAIGRVL